MSYNAKCDKECTTMPGPRLHNKHFMTNLLAHKQAGQICYKTIMYHSKKNQSKITFITLLLPS